MDENAHLQTVVIDFSKRREYEPTISRTFVCLILLDYKEYFTATSMSLP